MTIAPVVPGFGLTRANRVSTAAFGRLRAGIGLEQARAEMDTIAHRLAAQYPQEDGGKGVVLTSLREHFSGGVRGTVLLLTGTAGLVLIGCVNFTISRERELAVRTALTRLIASMLYGVKPADPATFVSVGGVLCATALLASLVPALRAARVDPARARFETNKAHA